MSRQTNAFLEVLILFLIVAPSAFAQTATAPTGSGTAGDPYLIATLDNLYWVTQHGSSWNSYFKQTADIDASSDSAWNGGKGFSFIGVNTNSWFGGTYDGGGHTITGIYINVDSINWVGPFAYCVGAHIKNLGIVNERVNAGGGNNAGQYVGGIAGNAISTSIDSSSTTGSVSGQQAVGGLVGYNSGSTITASFSSDAVTGYSGNVGGITGENLNSSTVTQSYFTGSVAGTGGNAGGIAGYNGSTITFCYTVGSINDGSFNVGAFIGANASGTVDSCFWNTDSSALAGFGNGSTTGAHGENSVALKDPSTFTSFNWDTAYWYMGDTINTGYPYLEWQNPGGTHLVTSVTPAGTGAPTAPYQIASLDNLYWLSQNSGIWGDYFEQTANIDASQTSGWNLGAGFSPIGNGTTAFGGTYSGAGYTISGLFISRDTVDYIGLFGLNDGTIDSVRLVNENVTGRGDVGGLAGYSQTAINNCSSSGSVTGNGTPTRVGGLVGANAGGTMNADYSSATVSGASVVGGLVGYNSGVYIISPSITNCYSTGSVSATDHVGGLVGENDGAFVGALIQSCYSAGLVSASGGSPNYSGGLVGVTISGGTVDSCFWDTLTSGTSVSSGGTGVSDAAMKTETTFSDSGWDFTNTWTINASVNSGYPILSWQNNAVLPVEMSSFTVAAASLNAVLRWTTATETNTSGWEIQRKAIAHFGPPSVATAAGRLPSADWIDAGFVKGAGVSTSPTQYSFVDRDLSAGTYSYRLKQVDNNGSIQYSKTVNIEVGNAPRVFSLSQNYPNPFNPTTTIEFTLPADGHVTLKVYDVLGKEVATLVDGDRKAGEIQQAIFDGIRYSSGVYFAVLRSGGTQLIRKMLMVK